MKTTYSVATLMLTSSLTVIWGQDLTLDPELYHEALRQVQGGDGIISRKSSDTELLQLWEEAMLNTDKSSCLSPEKKLTRQLHLVFLFKQLNPSASIESIAQLIKLHESALAGQLAAQTTILQALQSGIDNQQRLWPRSEQLAKRWMLFIAQQQ